LISRHARIFPTYYIYLRFIPYSNHISPCFLFQSEMRESRGSVFKFINRVLTLFDLRRKRRVFCENRGLLEPLFQYCYCLIESRMPSELRVSLLPTHTASNETVRSNTPSPSILRIAIVFCFCGRVVLEKIEFMTGAIRRYLVV